MRQSKIEKMRAAKQEKIPPTQLTNYNDFLALLLGGPPNPTQKAFIDDPDPFKAFMGAAGSAKTTAGVAAILMRGLFQPGTKWAICRQDYNKLLNTTYDTFNDMLNKLPPGLILGRDKTPPMQLFLQPIGGGEPFKITWLGLKDNLGSYPLHGAFVDEADDVDEKKILELSSRLRLKGAPNTLMLAFNPPDTNHYLHTLCTGLNDKGQKTRDPMFKLYTPQYRENAANLKPGYYEELERTLPKDMADRLVRGLWGTSFAGTPVYRQFNPQLHSRELKYSRYDTLLRFWDFGYKHPACIWAQVDPNGRVLILREEMETDKELVPFIEKVKAITHRHFRDLKTVIVDYGDVAVKQRRDTGAALTILARSGIKLRSQYMRIDVSVRALRRKFEQLIDGEPAIQIDSHNCSILTRALKGGYRMDDDGKEPFKDGFYDHLCDALRYGIVNVFGVVDNGYKPPELGSMPTQNNSLEYRRENDPGVQSSVRTQFSHFSKMGK